MLLNANHIHCSILIVMLLTFAAGLRDMLPLALQARWDHHSYLESRQSVTAPLCNLSYSYFCPRDPYAQDRPKLDCTHLVPSCWTSYTLAHPRLLSTGSHSPHALEA